MIFVEVCKIKILVISCYGSKFKLQSKSVKLMLFWSLDMIKILIYDSNVLFKDNSVEHFIAFDILIFRWLLLFFIKKYGWLESLPFMITNSASILEKAFHFAIQKHCIVVNLFWLFIEINSGQVPESLSEYLNCHFSSFHLNCLIIKISNFTILTIHVKSTRPVFY